MGYISVQFGVTLTEQYISESTSSNVLIEKKNTEIYRIFWPTHECDEKSLGCSL